MWRPPAKSHTSPRARPLAAGSVPSAAVGADPDPPSGRRYRKVVSNVCEGGVDPRQSPTQLQCPLTPPRGLQVSVRGEAVAVRPGEDVLFVVRQEQVSMACRPRGVTPAGPAGDGVCGCPLRLQGVCSSHPGGRFPS